MEWQGEESSWSNELAGNLTKGRIKLARFPTSTLHMSWDPSLLCVKTQEAIVGTSRSAHRILRYYQRKGTPQSLQEGLWISLWNCKGLEWKKARGFTVQCFERSWRGWALGARKHQKPGNYYVTSKPTTDTLNSETSRTSANDGRQSLLQHHFTHAFLAGNPRYWGFRIEGSESIKRLEKVLAVSNTETPGYYW